ncbi:hypothetical protein [Candidatus Berkiella aquae]|uniref:Uncharacterized protein n=1 Tax=Candidatus Berkiella aquae TaxID=295108 RepID=A0A0Q9YD48_9GAMM|nr:hypothetical protein [Candidatus Berkiella aquae]MCS5709897.1 hypothetical protein [Candidatus Berkiella aquae]
MSLDFMQCQETLLAQLKRTKLKCEKLSQGVENQERYLNVAVVPHVVENRVKASTAYKETKAQIKFIANISGLEAFSCALAVKQGLFFRIFRGRMNKHFTAKLDDQTLQSKITFKK